MGERIIVDNNGHTRDTSDEKSYYTGPEIFGLNAASSFSVFIIASLAAEEISGCICDKVMGHRA